MTRPVVFVTGCSSGIGLQTALAFAERGDRVFAGVRDPASADVLATSVAPFGDAVSITAVDVTDAASVTRAVDEAVAAAGRLDVVVNNAGIGCMGPVEALSEPALQQLFDTNFFGAWRVTRATLPVLRAQGSGVIVNVSSVDGRLPGRPLLWAYQATKHALGVMSEALAAEVAPFGIRVRAIEPGFYATEIRSNRRRRDAAAAEAGAVPAVDPQARLAYRELEQSVEQWMVANAEHGGDPRVVAAAIVEAALDPAPQPVHRLVGDDAVAAVAELQRSPATQAVSGRSLASSEGPEQ